MTDRPVIGQLGRTDATETKKVEFIGELRPEEWDEFIACVKECAKRFGDKITVNETTYRVRIKILDKLKPKKKP